MSDRETLAQTVLDSGKTGPHCEGSYLPPAWIAQIQEIWFQILGDEWPIDKLPSRDCSLDFFEGSRPARAMTRTVNRVLLTKLFQQFGITTSQLHLDVGSGLGEMRRILPQGFAQSTCVMLDLSHEFLATAQNEWRGAYTMLVQAGADRSLPFGDGTFPLVTSLSALDLLTYSEIQNLMTDLSRVLSEGGYFINVFDLQVNLYTILLDLIPEGMPFPYYPEGKPSELNFIVIPWNMVGDLAQASFEMLRLLDSDLESGVKKTLLNFAYYLTNPILYAEMCMTDSRTLLYLRGIHDIVQSGLILLQASKGEQTFKVVNPFTYFESAIVEGARKAGLTILLAGPVAETLPVKRKNLHDPRAATVNSYYISHLGRIVHGIDPKPAGRNDIIQVTSTVHVVIAKK
jgi:SAM-dependent methyltransferase